MKEETAFAVIVTSQIPVFIGWRKLALVSPDTSGITLPGAAESKGLQIFFPQYIRVAHRPVGSGRNHIFSSVILYDLTGTLYVCELTNTHIQRNFLLGLNRQFRKMLQKPSEARLVQSETSKQYHCSSVVRSFIL